jgi:DNA-binding response OmpR family regulator
MMEKAKVLLAESNYSFAQTVKSKLEQAGFFVTPCYDGENAWKEFNNKRVMYDLCLLDVILPKKSGFELTKAIRNANARIPILFISSSSTTTDILDSYKHGADAYLKKPISMQELICRMRVFLKRSNNWWRIEEKVQQHTFKIGNLILNYTDRLLTDIDGNEISSLTPKTVNVLRYLCQNPNRFISRNEILYAVWGQTNQFNSRSMDVFLLKIRKMLKDEKEVSIETLHGRGLRFNIPIQQTPK